MIKRIHQIWLEGAPKEEYLQYIESVKRFNPSWEYCLWTEETLPKDFVYRQVKRSIGRADIARFEVVERFGGVYLDCDIECFASIDSLFKVGSLFTLGVSGGPEIALVGAAEKNHPFFIEYKRGLNLERIENMKLSPLSTTGNNYIAPILRKYNDYAPIAEHNDVLIHRSGASWLVEDELGWVTAQKKLMYNIRNPYRKDRR